MAPGGHTYKMEWSGGSWLCSRAVIRVLQRSRPGGSLGSVEHSQGTVLIGTSPRQLADAPARCRDPHGQEPRANCHALPLLVPTGAASLASQGTAGRTWVRARGQGEAGFLGAAVDTRTAADRAAAPHG